MEDSQEEDYSFLGNDTFPNLALHEFMSENVRVNIWRDKFTSDYLRVNLPSLNLSRISGFLVSKETVVLHRWER